MILNQYTQYIQPIHQLYNQIILLPYQQKKEKKKQLLYFWSNLNHLLCSMQSQFKIFPGHPCLHNLTQPQPMSKSMGRRAGSKHGSTYQQVYFAFGAINTFLLSQVVSMSRRQLRCDALSQPAHYLLLSAGQLLSKFVICCSDPTLFTKGACQWV